jgi:tRNA dimethylallyltransferase
MGTKIKKDKILVIVGPTSSGKSDLAVLLAKKFNGEVISADSRQVYKGMDIGTGKITKKEMGGIKHYLLDVVSPKSVFTVVKFKKLADKAILDILKRGKTPIIAGGTGFYIQAVVDNIVLPEVKPDNKLRKNLEKKSTEELFEILKNKDKRRSLEIDSNNRHRLIRAIEIATYLGKVPEVQTQPALYDILQIGILTDNEVLKDKIKTRLLDRMRQGMMAEVKKLHKEGVSWKRMESLGLEYRYLTRYLRGKLEKDEMLKKLEFEIWHYAKRQKTWFKRDKRIKWFMLKEKNKIEKEVKDFLRP